jgi:hypothetical protein
MTPKERAIEKFKQTQEVAKKVAGSIYGTPSKEFKLNEWQEAQVESFELGYDLATKHEKFADEQILGLETGFLCGLIQAITDSRIQKLLIGRRN